MAKKLSKAIKAKNKAKYNEIRKIYNKVVKDKSDLTYMQFRNNVKGLLNIKKKRNEEEKSITKFSKEEIKNAAIKESRTDTIWEPWERSRDNLMSGLKTKHPEAYDKLKNLGSRYSGKTIRDENGKITKRTGQFQSITDNLTWDKERKGYILNAGDKKYFIDVSNSPETVSVVELKEVK